MIPFKLKLYQIFVLAIAFADIVEPTSTCSSIGNGTHQSEVLSSHEVEIPRNGSVANLTYTYRINCLTGTVDDESWEGARKGLSLTCFLGLHFNTLVTYYYGSAVAFASALAPTSCTTFEVSDIFAQMKSKCGSNRASAYIFGIPPLNVPGYGIFNRDDEIVECPWVCYQPV
jgi:hypothetical protein